MHAGLKFGIYTAQREFTCQRRPGSFQHEAIDVNTYCDWGKALLEHCANDEDEGVDYPPRVY